MSRILVLGGARSGKSTYAESALSQTAAVRYVATGYPAGDDPDWASRVAQHRQRRPESWTTVETLDLADVLADASTPILIDCMSLWLTRTLDAFDAWNADTLPSGVTTAVDEVVWAWASSAADVIAVSNETGLGVIPSTRAGAMFRDELGNLNRRLAAVSDEVWLLIAGLPQRLK